MFMFDKCGCEPIFQIGVLDVLQDFRYNHLRLDFFGYQHGKSLASPSRLDRQSIVSIFGDYTKAEPLYRKALAISRKVLGLEHPDTATCLNNLAELYRDMGDYPKAVPLCRKALAIRR